MNRRELLLSSLGLAVLPLDTALARSPAPQKWALLIGVDRYDSPGIVPLKGAANDAIALANLLSGQGFRILLFADSEPANRFARNPDRDDPVGVPRRNEILEAVSVLSERVQEGDQVVVFFAGHGCEDGSNGGKYLLAADARTATVPLIRRTALSLTDLEAPLLALQQAKKAQVVVVYDMCRVEIDPAKRDATLPKMTSTLQGGERGAFDFSQAVFPSARPAPVFVRWWSCSAGERSYERQVSDAGAALQWRGYFTYALERALKSSASLPLSDLMKGVRTSVASAVQTDKGASQLPRVAIDAGEPGDLAAITFLGASPSGKANQVLKPTTARLAFSGLPEGAVVSVDGSLVTGDEYREDMADKTKSVSVSISAPGYKQYSQTVEIKRGALVTESPKLVPTPLARLVFPKLPPGAIVKIDGKTVDPTEEYREEIASATKSVEVTVSGLPVYKPYVADVELKRGALVRAEIALEKRDPNPMPVKELEPEPKQPVGKGKFASAAETARGKNCPELAKYLEQMQAIPAGNFNMGSESGDSDEKPVHSVELSNFWMGRTLVWQELWAEYAQKGDGTMPDAPSWGWLKNHPIVKVSWVDIQGFCRWASGVSEIALTVPSEAQWEYASRGGGKDVKYPWGNDWDSTKCIHFENSDGKTAPVDFPERLDRYYMVKFSNDSELLDMGGNVWQWCWDLDGPYSSGNATNPVRASSGVNRVLRGGSWVNDDPANFRCADRGRNAPGIRIGNNGFRLSAGSS